MYTIEWDDAYSVGNYTIDTQHKKLFRLLESVQEFNNEQIPTILTELEAYILYHFRFEEKMQEQINYDLQKEHKSEHQHFIDKVAEARKQFGDGDLSISMLFSMLSEWLLNHILIADKKMTPFIEQN